MDAMTLLAGVAVALLALLVGFAIAVLLEARATLRSARQFLDSTSAKVDVAVAEAARLTARLNRVMDAVEGDLPRVRRVLEATDGVTDSIAHVRSSLKAVTAIGPAAFAAARTIVSSFMGPRPRREDADMAAIAAAESEGMTPHAAVS